MHGVVIHKGSVTLQVELAQSENSQRDEGDGENQTQQRVWCTTTFCDTEDMNGGERGVNSGYYFRVNVTHILNDTTNLQRTGCRLRKLGHTDPLGGLLQSEQ